MTLGTAALMPFLRRPVQAAQSLASVDLLSGGRLTVTVGAGFPGRFGRPLHTLSELPWARRFARLDETVALWRALWDGADGFHGEILRFADVPPTTRPFRAGGPPVRLGGATPAALARTGRIHDGRLPYPPDPADHASGLRAVREAAAGAGRPAGDITPALFVSVRVDDDVESGRRAPDGYARAAYGMPLPELERIQAVVTGSAGQVAEHLGRYVAVGVRHMAVRLGAVGLRSQRDQLERVADLVPAVGAGFAPRPRGTRAVRPGEVLR